MPSSLRRIPPRPQVLPVTTASPGKLGLNLQQAQSILPPEWSTEAANAVIDYSGRTAARNPLNTVTVTPIGGNPPILTIFEQITTAGAGNTPIIAWNGGISTSIANPSGSLISGTAPIGNGTWLFYNFIDKNANQKVIGFQAGQKIIVRNGSGNFATVVETAGTASTGGIGMVGYGRVWQVAADGHTINYSALLDETTWGSGHGDAGSFDMAEVWSGGTDTIQAIVPFNYAVVVFGMRQIVFLASPDATALGMDVTTLAVVDHIEGTGCVSQFTVQHVGTTDLVWLAPTGIQSMARLLVERSRPTTQLSKYVRDALIGQLITETPNNLRSAYSPTYGFYLLSFPNSGYTWVVDMRYTWTDQEGDTVAPVTRWLVAPTAMFETIERQLYTSALVGGSVAQYEIGTENGGTFNFTFTTPWMDLGTEYAQRLKALKRIGALILSGGGITVSFTYNTDFGLIGTAAGVVTPNSTGNAQWGIGQWGIDQWSGGQLLQFLRVPAYATGQFFQISITAAVSGQFAIQTSEIIAKLGRIA